MSKSRLIGRRFAIDLSGLALGIWEAAFLLSRNTTRDEGHSKIEYLRDRLQSYKKQLALSDSLSFYLHTEFDPAVYSSMLDRLEREDVIKDIIPEIQELVDKTHAYINESRRQKADFRRPI